MYLARSKGRTYIKIEEVARNEDIPRNFLSKIFQILIKNGMVDSYLGPKGGVRLSSDSQRTSVAEVLTVINGRMNQEDCALFGYQRCPELVSCPIHNECQNVRKKIWGKLKKLTLNKL
jgi:Rrf2 family protein